MKSELLKKHPIATIISLAGLTFGTGCLEAKKESSPFDPPPYSKDVESRLTPIKDIIENSAMYENVNVMIEGTITPVYASMFHTGLDKDGNFYKFTLTDKDGYEIQYRKSDHDLLGVSETIVGKIRSDKSTGEFYLEHGFRVFPYWKGPYDKQLALLGSTENIAAFLELSKREDGITHNNTFYSAVSRDSLVNHPEGRAFKPIVVRANPKLLETEVVESGRGLVQVGDDPWKTRPYEVTSTSTYYIYGIYSEEGKHLEIRSDTLIPESIAKIGGVIRRGLEPGKYYMEKTVLFTEDNEVK